MQVLKFGGSSVANSQNINKVIAIVREALKKDRTAVVSSAISGATDLLIKIAASAKKQDANYIEYINELENRHIELINELIPHDTTLSSSDQHSIITTECRELFNKLREICKGVYLLKELSEPSLDHIVSFGELLSTKIISAKLSTLNVQHTWKDSRELIKTQYIAGKNLVIEEITHQNIADFFATNNNSLFILPGFIASDLEGRTTTLGRGGSDYTASILAVGAHARILEIWTDVCGMMTSDPRIVKEAKPIRNISYKEALELSHFGAKVVYPPTIQPVVKLGIPIYVKNTFAPEDEGTLIERNPPAGKNKIRGISSSNKIALLSMEGAGMVGIPGYSSKLFQILSQNNINIILITQASSVHTMCIAIDEVDADRAKLAADELFAYEISLGKVDPLRVEKGFSIISLVGDDMKNQSGASGKMFDALGREGINIRAIAQGSSEKNVSAVVHTDNVNEAIKAIHNEFFTKDSQRINLFIAGYGTIGKALIDIIDKKKGYIKDKQGKEIVICGLSNSKNFIISRSGVDVDKLTEGDKLIGNNYIEAIANLKLGNSIFVDCTANKAIAGSYSELFRNKISVVTCNKIANSSPLENYKDMFAIAKHENVSYKYETTVCAALPVLATIEHLANCGDQIKKVQGILSGTLNYLFSAYDGSISFSELVKEAKEKGYAEPDPRLDLAGTDVLRKFIILSREAGLEIEPEDIDFNSFIPDSIMNSQQSDFNSYQDDFYSKLEAYEPELLAKYNNAKAAGAKLRFIATLEEGENGFTKKIALEEVGKEHPFYPLEGTDNAVIIESDFYPQGVVIKGAGAGAYQTAGGVLNDILRTI